MFNTNQIAVTAKIKRDHLLHIREIASHISPIDDEWDLVCYPSDSRDEAVKEALWYSDLLIIESPKDFREAVVEALTKVVQVHDR
jgi:predicted DNA-binding transcriptional regulator YafY